jgi:hypothetical protein
MLVQKETIYKNKQSNGIIWAMLGDTFSFQHEMTNINCPYLKNHKREGSSTCYNRGGLGKEMETFFRENLIGVTWDEEDCERGIPWTCQDFFH